MNSVVGWLPGQRALLRLLQRRGVLESAPTAPDESRPRNADLFECLAESIDQDSLVALVAETLRTSVVDLDRETLMQDLLSLISAGVATECEMIPLAQCDDVLEVAAANPLDLDAVKTVEFATGLRVRPRVATRASIMRALTEWYGAPPEPSPVSGTDAEPTEPTDDGKVSIVLSTAAITAPSPDAPPETVAEPATPAAPGQGAGVTEPTPAPPEPSGPPAVLVVSPDVAVRNGTRAVLEAAVTDAVILTTRDIDEARLVLTVGRIEALVVDPSDPGVRPLPEWEQLAAETEAVLISCNEAGGDAELAERLREILNPQRGEPV